MKFFKIYLLFISSIISAQTSVKLRDVSFKVPEKFKFVNKENVKIKYDLFYENGKISIDSANTQYFPKIAYQYYEKPVSTEDSKIVLNRLNEIMTKDFKPDTLFIDGKNNLSIAKYKIMGISTFEVKSLGENGWLNIGYVDAPENDSENFKIVKEIAYSIHHSRIYNAKNKERIEDSENSTKYLIIALIMLLLVTGIRKLINKNDT